MDIRYFQAYALENIQDAVIGIDETQRIIFWNHGAELLYETTREEAMGVTLSEIYRYEYIPPATEATVFQSMKEIGSYRGNYRHITRSNRELYVEATTSVILKDGESLGMLAIIRDCTESYRMTIALKETVESLKAERTHSATLEEMITVCAWSGLIKNGEEWIRMEEFLMKRFGFKVSHGMSPEVLKQQMETIKNQRSSQNLT
ncbi:MAG: PAS domain S-box protein [Chloroherpetonaceae bacterium]|nr:PAS domain S-box protein [Chloroherpetonaceae bacterium]